MHAITALLSLLCLIGACFILRSYRRCVGIKSNTKRLANLLGGAAAETTRESHALRFDPATLLPGTLSVKLQKAGITITSGLCIKIGILFGVLFVIAGLVIGPLAGLAALAIASFGLIITIDILMRRRMDRLAAALPGFFDRLRQSLAVGNSISVAFERATSSSPPIVIEFFSPTVRRIANGGGIAESVNQLADELDIYELRQFAVAIETNLRFGGSLTVVIANLIENFRRRSTIEREIRSNTAQIRASAQILAALPIGVACLVFVKSPDYLRFFIHEETGRKLLFYCIVSQIIGGILMRKIVRVSF